MVLHQYFIKYSSFQLPKNPLLYRGSFLFVSFHDALAFIQIQIICVHHPHSYKSHSIGFVWHTEKCVLNVVDESRVTHQTMGNSVRDPRYPDD